LFDMQSPREILDVPPADMLCCSLLEGNFEEVGPGRLPLITPGRVGDALGLLRRRRIFAPSAADPAYRPTLVARLA